MENTILTYRISLQYPSPYPELLTLFTKEAQHRRFPRISYEEKLNWLRIRLYLPISPASSEHSTVGFGCEIIPEVKRNNVTIPISTFLSEYSFWLSYKVIPVFELIENRSILQITCKFSKKNQKLLKNYGLTP